MPKTPSFRFPMSPSPRRRPRSSRPTCEIRRKRTGEILISVDTGWRRTNSSRCRARRLVLRSARVAHVYKDIVSLFQELAAQTIQNPCDMGVDLVIDTTGKLTIEADILAFDPYRVTATGA